MTTQIAHIGADWPRRWPCSVFAAGDIIRADFDDSGDLIGLDYLAERARDGDPDAAELGAALACYTLDMSARYAVAGYDGIAFYLRGYVETADADTDWTGEKVTDYAQVRAVMVGDDREHVLDVADLTALDDDDYCGECGQIGCSHDGRLTA